MSGATWGVNDCKAGVRGLLMYLCVLAGWATVSAATVSERCWFTDISAGLDGQVNLEDFSVLAGHWLAACSEDNLWCDQADFDRLNGVDMDDFMTLLDCWCAQDEDPPSLDPAQWQVTPQIAAGTVDTIEMVAAQQRDVWWPDWTVEYYFECTDPQDGPDRDWSVDRSFMVSGLLPGTYRFVTRARDGSGNETPASAGFEVAIGSGADLPQTQWASEPNGVSDTSIYMATTAYEDYEGVLALPPEYTVKYEFDATSSAGGADGRDYTIDPTYTDNVAGDNLYSYRVRMGLFYESSTTPEVKLQDGPWSDEVSVILGIYDTTKPTPDPAEFDSSLMPQVQRVNGKYYHGMKAVEASDENGVEYYFELINSDGNIILNSDWRSESNTAGETNPTGDPIAGPREYWVKTDFAYTSYFWRVRYRDGSPQQEDNVTDFSPAVQVLKMYQ